MKGCVFTDPEEHRFEPAVVELLSVAPAVEADRRESSGRSLSTTLPTQLPFFTDGHSVSMFVLSTRQSADYALSTSPPPGLPWPRSHRDPSLFTHGSPLLWPGWWSCLIRESFITHPLSSGDDDSVTASWLLQFPSPSFFPLCLSLASFLRSLLKWCSSSDPVLSSEDRFLPRPLIRSRPALSALLSSLSASNKGF